MVGQAALPLSNLSPPAQQEGLQPGQDVRAVEGEHRLPPAAGRSDGCLAMDVQRRQKPLTQVAREKGRVTRHGQHKGGSGSLEGGMESG